MRIVSLIIFMLWSITGITGPVVGSRSAEWGIIITPCQWCGTTNNIEVHHKISQAECKRLGRLDLIHNTNNMVCLCRTDGKGCHFYIGHHAKSWDYVFTNVMDVINIGKTNKVTLLQRFGNKLQELIK